MVTLECVKDADAIFVSAEKQCYVISCLDHPIPNNPKNPKNERNYNVLVVDNVDVIFTSHDTIIIHNTYIKL